MGKMRLINADALKQTWLFTGDNSKAYRDAIDDAPTVDAVPVIRCKECKYHRNKNACEKDGCFGWYETDYCSRAERKDNGESN